MLNVTMGIPLGNIPDIRKFYEVPVYGIKEKKIDFNTMRGKVHGHVVAARITAENPEEGFQPTSGNISELVFRNMVNVWGYFSTYAGVHEFSDSQFGHVFAWGEDRETARRTMQVHTQSPPQLDFQGTFSERLLVITGSARSKSCRFAVISAPPLSTSSGCSRWTHSVTTRSQRSGSTA